jgi:hypothetical protein
VSARDDEIRRVVAELDVHIAEVEASVAVLKALLADGDVPGEEDPRLRWEAACKRVDAPSFFAPSLAYRGGACGYAASRSPAGLGALMSC